LAQREFVKPEAHNGASKAPGMSMKLARVGLLPSTQLVRMPRTALFSPFANRLLTALSLVAEYGSTGTLLRRYVHGARVDDPIIWYEGATFAASGRRQLSADRQGSIVATADRPGTASFWWDLCGADRHVSGNRESGQTHA